jgi:hypothetical protein
MREDRYITANFYRFCVNLEPNHYEYLKELATREFLGNYSEAILYLIKKYLRQLYDIRITPTKGTETASYQPKTKSYRRWVIRINPVLWSKLFEMRHFIGYSMSALLRVMLDWEMQGRGYDIIPMISMPEVEDDREGAASGFIELNNYDYEKFGEYETRRIFCRFIDEFS